MDTVKPPNWRSAIRILVVFLRQKKVKRVLQVILVLVLIKLVCINYNEPTELGIARNFITGKMWAQRGGWHFTAPWTLVSRIDIQPMRVTVDSAGRGYSGKLIQFVPEQWEVFVKTEGWRFWWFANRLSFNFGYEDEHRGIKDILRGYAYGSKEYPFLVIIKEFVEQQ